MPHPVSVAIGYGQSAPSNVAAGRAKLLNKSLQKKALPSSGGATVCSRSYGSALSATIQTEGQGRVPDQSSEAFRFQVVHTLETPATEMVAPPNLSARAFATVFEI